MKVLVVDVGGSNVKLWHSSRTRKRKFYSGPNLTPHQMVAQVLERTADWDYDRISLGLPCRVLEGRPLSEPENLGPGWIDFDYDAFGKPVRIINDADLQALGCYRGGRMLFVGLGTGVGSALIADNVIVSLDLGRVRLNGREVCQLLGKATLKRIGKRKWSRYVREILPELMHATMATELAVGGGKADEVKRLPENARHAPKSAAKMGGVRLWSELPDPRKQDGRWRLI